MSALLVVLAVLGTLGGGGLMDAGYALRLQTRAADLHSRWASMVTAGIPAYELASLEQEWVYGQAQSYLGVGAMFWLPGARATLDRWAATTDQIWVRDLNTYRAGAIAVEQSLHRAIGPEPLAQRKARLEVLTEATTPADFAALRATWALEARLVPIDRRIATATGTIAQQASRAKTLGIRSEPAADLLAQADAYRRFDSQDRLARAELLTRGLTAAQKDLQGRLDAAAITQSAMAHANSEITAAGYYGLDLSAYQSRVAADLTKYGSALTPAEFNAITADLNAVAASADHAIYLALNAPHVISGITFYYQDHPLSCEEAATSMALSHQGINVSEDQILAEIGADTRPMYVDGQGRVRWGNPYQTFVGKVDGSESNYTGFGTFYPPLVRVAKAHGARILAYGSMSAATIYARVIAGHPVVAFATWDWQWHPRRDYLSFDGQWIPWIGPVYASHAYVVAGVSPTQVLIDDPIRGQYWISKGAFEAGYSDFHEAIVFA
ncbi:MAG TPA: C39 family peptidase [Candidatus Dormibacteraeota bacterium]|nr:C39 family peptidase [Candidatus Dormibacteraeota bacterium]